MGCISCKTVEPDIDKKDLRGKARLPGISRKKRKNKIPLNKTPEDISAKINREKAKILQQLEDENIIAKKASGGVAYVFTDENDKGPTKAVCPPKILERLQRPSTSMGFNSEEREIMADCLKQDSLQSKGRQAKLSEDRRFFAEMNRERAMRLKAFKLESKMKLKEEKLQQLNKMKKKIMDANISAYEKQMKAKYRREVAKRQKEASSGDKNFKEVKDSLLGNSSMGPTNNEMGMPGVDV